MSAKTYTLTTIRQRIDPEKEIVVADGDLVYILDDETARLKMIFKKAGHRYVEINFQETIAKIAEKLAPHVQVETFLKELIACTTSPQEILELKERLAKGEVKISSENRCYSLLIGGKRGRPMEFTLVK